jgi:3-oxoacyl-[acyl-carrier protein] reductase
VITEKHFHKQYDLNVLGLLLTTQEAVKLIGPDGGSSINISSAVSTFTPPGAAAYAGTKAAVDAITKVLSKELGPRKIRVNSINPGMVETEGTRSFTESEFRQQLEKESPLGRIGQPQDIAGAAVFLACDDSSWITGESLIVSGGIR